MIRIVSVVLANSVLAQVSVIMPVQGTSATLQELRTPSTISRPIALVFDGVTVVDVEHGSLSAGQRVVIVGNRIQAVGRRQVVRMPRGVRVVPALGRYLIPGLWDMHVHLFDSPAKYRELIANGVTGIRDAGSSPPLDTLMRWRREVLAGVRAGPPRQFFSGQATDEERSCTRTNASAHTCVSGPDDARHYVDSIKAAGADVVKTYSLSIPTYFAIAAEARRIGIPFGGHLPDGLDGMTASDSGALILDHETYFRPDVCGSYSSKITDTNTAQCAVAAARLRRNQTWVTDYMAGAANGHFADNASDSVLRWLRYGGPALFQAVGKEWTLPTATERRRFPSTADWVAAVGIDSATGRPAGCEGPAVAYAANLPVLANTDALGPPPGSGIHLYMMIKVLCGASPLWALQAATINPARALRLTDSLGTVAQGKIADLVLLDGNPLTDIWNVSRIRAVVANGRYYDRAALDELLTEAARRMDRTNIRGTP